MVCSNTSNAHEHPSLTSAEEQSPAGLPRVETSTHVGKATDMETGMENLKAH